MGCAQPFLMANRVNLFYVIYLSSNWFAIKENLLSFFTFHLGVWDSRRGLPVFHGVTTYRFNLFLLQNCCCSYQKISKFHRTSKNYISKMICYLSLTWHLTVCRWVTGFCSTCSARTWTAWSSRRWCTSWRGGSDTRARTSTMRRLPRVMVSSSPLIMIYWSLYSSDLWNMLELTVRWKMKNFTPIRKKKFCQKPDSIHQWTKI